MANSYVDPNFNIDTSCNVAALATLKNGAPDADDKIYVYNGATLTVEQALACLIISLGETSAGAAADGQRRGNITINAGQTITFTGNATATNSGLKVNPASAPGTALESKSCTLTILGTAGSPSVFTNSVGAFNSSNRYMVQMYFGVLVAGTLTMNYASTGSGASSFIFPASATYTTATSFVFDGINVATGNTASQMVIGDWCANAATTSIDYGRLNIDQSGVSVTGGSFTPHTPTAGLRGSGQIAWRGVIYKSATHATSSLLFLPRFNASGSAAYLYFSAGKVDGTNDVRPTILVPTTLAAADSGTDGELTITWANGGSYAAGDEVIVYNSVGNAILGRLDATAGTGKITGLTNGNPYTVYAKASRDNFVFSAATANAGAATPTDTAVFPTVGNVHTGINYGPTGADYAGTLTHPAVTAVHDGVQYGAGGNELTGTLTHPAVADVESGVQYGAGGVELTGTFTKPAVGDVQSGVQYGGGGVEFTGTFDAPATGDVRDGTGYGAGGVEFSGTLELPLEADVEFGGGFGDGGAEFTGAFVAPLEADVEFGVDYGAAAEFTGSFVVPADTDVRDGISYGAAGVEFTGDVELPVEGDVEFGVGYGSGGVEFTGDVTLPLIADVETGVSYGSGGVEFTGIFDSPAEGDVEARVGYGAAGAEFTGDFAVPQEATVQLGVTYGSGGVEFTGNLVGGGGLTAAQEAMLQELHAVVVQEVGDTRTETPAVRSVTSTTLAKTMNWTKAGDAVTSLAATRGADT